MKRAIILLVLLATSAVASADAYLRVIAQKASVHSGPGNGYREVAVAERNQVYEVLERGTNGYWFKIMLDDGTTGWIVGDVVYPFEVGEEEEPGAFTRMGRAIKRAILGPSPVAYANVGLSFSSGLLEGEGVYILRPSWIIDPYWALEGFAGLSPRSEKDIYLGGFAFVLRLAPGAVIGPYATLGLGCAHISPKADNYVDPRENLMALGAGGGLEITLKKQITVRLDVRNWSLFNQNHSNNGQEYTGGLAIFFKAMVLAVVLSACGRTAVRASEKEFLADQVMVFDNDPHETASDDHIMTNREGAAGGHGAGGGGCGCN